FSDLPSFSSLTNSPIFLVYTLSLPTLFRSTGELRAPAESPGHPTRHPRDLRLRVRIADGADEPQNGTANRNRFLDAGRNLQLLEFSAGPRDRAAGRLDSGAGAARGRTTAARQGAPSGPGGSYMTMQLAERVNRISVSPTMAVLTEAERYKARGI